MKWKKQVNRFLVFLGIYVVFTMICNVLNCCMEEYSEWFSYCWYFATFLFWIATAMIWVSLLKKMIR